MKKLLLVALAVAAFAPVAKANILTDLFGPPYVAPQQCNPIHANWVNPAVQNCMVPVSGTIDRPFVPADHCRKPTAS